MAAPTATEIIRSPAGGVMIGGLSSLILASFATAGLNTMTVARLMLVAAFCGGALYVLRSTATAYLTKRQKAGSLAIWAVALIAIERVETWAQPTPATPPVPPLMLMLKPAKLGYRHPLTMVPGIPLAMSYVDRPTGGYAGFGEIGEGAKDDAALGIGELELVNLSDAPLILSWELHVTGEGRSFRLNGDGKGRWERQINRNDWLALRGSGLKWLLSPLILRPKQRLSLARIIFLAPNVDKETKNLIFRNTLLERYLFRLQISEHNTQTTATLRLPFGLPAVPDPQAQELLRKSREGLGLAP